MAEDDKKRHSVVVRMKRCRFTWTFHSKTAVLESASDTEADIGAGRIGKPSESYTVAEAVSAYLGDA